MMIMNRFIRYLILLILFQFILSDICFSSGSKEKILTLPMAIELAIKNNSLIREAVERQKAAIEAEKSARADLFPELSAIYSYTRLKETPYAKFGPTRMDIGEKDNFHWEITVTQPIFTGFSLLTLHKMAELGVDIASLKRQEAIIEISKRVKLAYFNILLARKMLKVAEEEVQQLESHVKDAEKFYREGLIPYNDLLKSKVALAHAIQSRVSAKSNLDIAISSLNTLLNLNINQKTKIEDILEIQPVLFNLNELFEEALENRPELKAMHLALKNAENRIRLARSSYYPQVALVANYEQSGDNLNASNNDFGNAHNASIFLQMKWRFFKGGKTKAEIRKALHEKRSLEEKLRGLKDLIRLQTKEAFLRLKVAEKNIETAKEALIQAKENFRITNLQYQQQMTTSTEVLDARTFLTQAEMNYYRALYGYRIELAELERALGRK